MPTITRITPYYAPDGFASLRLPRNYAELKSAVAAAVGRRAMPVTVPAMGEDAQAHMAVQHNEDGFDEGLVHSHGWARN